MQKKVVIFGTGLGAKIAVECLRNNVDIISYIDNNHAKIGTLFNNIVIGSILELKNLDFDYLILSMFYNYDKVIGQLKEISMYNEKTIAFFKMDNDEKNNKYEDIFVENWSYKSMYYKQCKDRERLEILWERRYKNLKYEIADKHENIENPKIMTIEQSICEICDKGLSLGRFGDGEFEIMRGNIRPMFQLPNEMLAKRLMDILNKKEAGFAVAIADNYGNLEQYTEHAADDIRFYLDEKTRAYHMQQLDRNIIYLNAYLSRPYIIFQNKSNAKQRFALLKKIWENREIVIVEGDKTRMGIGNDLFENTQKVQRIIAPNENAYDCYEEILQACINVGKGQLFLIALGPTATVLAYDLFKNGIQAIDIGHLDNEYEWYKAKVTHRTKIRDKYVSEVCGGNNVLSVKDKPIEGIISVII